MTSSTTSSTTTSSVTDLRKAVAGLMGRAKDDLAELVAFRSVADPKQFPPEECERAAQWVIDAFSAAGMQDVTASLVASIETLGVDPVQLAHGRREVTLWSLQEQMEVIAHQAVRMATHAVAHDHGGQHDEEPRTVLVVKEDLLTIVPASGRVIDAAGELQPERARHASTDNAPGPVSINATRAAINTRLNSYP